jgi:catechol 2,3-dioxygenase-like lactoylglutathione lyase family enzyme
VFDHVTIRGSEIEESRRFYETALAVLGFDEPVVGSHFVEWNDFSISAAREDKPVTQGLHVGCVAPSRAYVDEFWRLLTGAGYRDDGEPGLRPQYRADYYGAFVLDPDGSSIEAVHHDIARTDGLVIDHLWLRVRDVDASKCFYETIAPVVGFDKHEGRWIHFHDEHSSFTIVASDVPTENVHLALPAPDNATVENFHRVALAAGYRDNGAPGERGYHAGYYGAFVLDPDGNNVEAVCHNRG